MKRCYWADSSEIDSRYHDSEWGVPVHDDRKLFEMLCLEGAQAGLSWTTILKKRAGYLKAFDNFDPEIVAKYSPEKIDELIANPAIVRHRLKILSVVSNAKAFLGIQKEFGSFDAYIWSFVDNQPIVNHWASASEVPATTPLSDSVSKDLKKRGFKFVGSTICYAYMQGIGMVNDHQTDCFRYGEVGAC
ncbi:DNA-3-methyladenine glycosylase I [Veronia pacifica]|uniref:DNA-3-methyladenine glycosylase I n=1 Tax=Veronia pacifica TaxID=1080227 RepID=A0A1C3EII0_9GAMM|nr:DNA-3-methyladenine glycosylase I [Veronia pacifica]ODA33052.1 DNA-3-methyladenine glycosylase [Veronia pacifica]